MDAAPAPAADPVVVAADPVAAAVDAGSTSTMETPSNTSGSNEDIKAVILNYGKWKDAKSMEVFLAEHNVDFLKVQKSRQLTFGFVHFRTREARDAALPVLQSLTWCGEPLEAKDALVKRSMQTDRTRSKKRKHHERDGERDGDGDGEESRAAKTDEPKAVPTCASDVATPWASVPYAEQLALKEAEMKKVLVKITRNTRKEFDKKEKRIAVDQRNTARKNKQSGNNDTPVPVRARTEFPQWLTSHGSMYVVANDVLYSRVVEADAHAAWTRVADAPGVAAIVSFGSELVAATIDNEICALMRKGQSRAWVKLCDGPGAAVTSLASLRGALLCCTADGRVLKQEGTGQFASGVWTEIGAVPGARVIGLFDRHLYAHCPESASESKWWRAPLTSEALEALVFEPWTAAVPEGRVVGLTSHNTDLILLTTELTYIDCSGRAAKTAPVVLDGAGVDTDNKDGAAAATAPVFTAFTSHKGLCCPMDSIHPSPVTEGYRNKCEFTIGLDVDGKPCVGFRLGLFREGLITTAKPDDCANVSQTMKHVCAAVQRLVETGEYPVYDVRSQDGVWRVLTVRESERTGDLMVVMQVKPPPGDGAIEALKQRLVAALTDASAPFKVTSIFLQQYDGVSAPAEDHPVEHVFGQRTIEEHLLGMRFSVSPGAFFQVNTRGAETLYSLVKDHAAADSNTLLYDVCCGTGTIGICASKGAHKVVGIELCKAATDDAAVNATLNGVENVSFINAKAEDVMKDLLKAKREDSEQHVSRAVAIVDPPRAGLHHQVLRALRACPPVERIVYVSCNPTGSLIQDAMMLCGPKTKTLTGDAFEPVHAIPVDMFPHTPHCEMIVVFERVKRGDKQIATAAQ